MSSPIAAIGAITSTPGTAPTKPTMGTEAGGSGFSDVLGSALQAVDASQTNADTVARDIALGTADPAMAMVALTEAQLVLEMATAVRNRAVEAFNEIMRMPV